MALTAYIAQTRRLLNDESAQFYSDADLTVYINLARGQIAIQTACLLATGTAVVTANPVGLGALVGPTGYLQAINVRSVSTVNTDGSRTLLEGRPWQWFNTYYLNGPLVTGTPTVWASFDQGVLGNFYVSPIGPATLSVEATWTPAVLVDDTTVEALSYPWTDCVPYFAAYLALMSAQREDDGQRLMSLYDSFVRSSRLGVTPGTMPVNFPTLRGVQGATDATMTNQVQNKPAQQAEGGV